MRQFKLATSLFISASLLSPTTFAHALSKDEAIAVAYNWTGFYAGLNAGIVRHTMNVTDDQAVTFSSTIQQVSNPAFTGGFQLGYRHQLDLTKISGVYGLELSANFSNNSFKHEYGSPFALYQLQSHHKLKNLVLLEFIGGIAADKTLLFVAAGLSWVNITGSTINMDGIPFFDSFSVNRKELGTAVGGGIEYAFSERISARFKVDVITPNSYNTQDNEGNNYQISNNIVEGTFGVNYKFG